MCCLGVAGAEIALSGRRKFFYIYDLQSGRVRKIHEIQGRKEKSLEHMYASPDDKYLVFTGTCVLSDLMPVLCKECKSRVFLHNYIWMLDEVPMDTWVTGFVQRDVCFLSFTTQRRS